MGWRRLRLYTEAAGRDGFPGRKSRDKKNGQKTRYHRSHAPKLGRTAGTQGKKRKNVAKCFRLFHENTKKSPPYVSRMAIEKV